GWGGGRGVGRLQGEGGRRRGGEDFDTAEGAGVLGEIGPGQAREGKPEVQAINLGEHKHKATAVGARGLRAEAEKLTRIEGLSALLLEMVDTEDPIEAGRRPASEAALTKTAPASRAG